MRVWGGGGVDGGCKTLVCYTAPRPHTPHLSQKIKGNIPHLLNLKCIGRKGILGLRSPEGTQHNKAASNDSADV